MILRVIHGLIAARWLLLALAVGLAAVAWIPAGDVEFDRSIENMFAADDPLLPPYERLKERFGGNEVVLAVYRDEDLLAADGSGLQRLAEVGDRLRKVPGVRDVLSLADVNRALVSMERLGRLRRLGPIRALLVKEPPTPPILRDQSAVGTRFRELFEGYTHDKSGQVAAVACMLVPESERTSESQFTRRQTIQNIRDIMQSLPDGLADGMIVGEPVMVVDGFAYLEADGSRLGWASTILLAVTIIICFRSLRWVVIPVVVVQLALLLTRAVLVWSQLRLSMVSSMLTAIVTVVGVATVVHVIVRFRQARGEGRTAREALAVAGGLVAAPICWACLTDAVGFASLLVAQVGPVRDFGVMMAVGSIMVLVSAALTIPGLALLGGWDDAPKRVWGERHLGTSLEALVRWVDARPRSVAAGLVLLAVAAAGGVWQLEVETDFTKNFRGHSPIVTSYTFIERNLGGAGVWDIVLPAPAAGLTTEFLDQVRELETRLRAIDVPGDASAGQTGGRLSKVISLVDAIDATSANPDLNGLTVADRVNGMAGVMSTFTAALYNREPAADGNRYLRIMLRAPERQAAESKQQLINQVREAVEQTFPGEPNESPRAEVTGFFVLLTNLIESMIRDQWVCFGVATTGIGLMMWLAFRSFRLAAVALVPNALPILVVLGGMGWLGLKINMGAAMIAAVSMGLSVDSSIHYISSFRRARSESKSLYVALADVQQTVGRAMVFSTLALMVGFTVLCTSQFVPTIYFGALVSLSMLGGLLGNLVVLPLLLKLVTRDA